MAVLLLLHVWLPLPDPYHSYDHICRSGHCPDLLPTLRVIILPLQYVEIVKTTNGGGGHSS